jgi:hypothetical protein
VFLFSTDASVTWEFSRAWRTRIAARRGLEYLAQLSEPVFVDGVSLEFEGLLTSRLDLSTAARYSSGASAIGREAITFDTYGADATLRLGLTRSLAVYGQLVYYFYDFGQSTGLPIGIPRGLERTGFRTGFSVWIPAVRR